MFSTIRLWVYGAVMAGLAGVAAFLYQRGKQSERDKSTRRRLDAMKKKKGIEDEVETMDDQRLIDLISRRD